MVPAVGAEAAALVALDAGNTRGGAAVAARLEGVEEVVAGGACGQAGAHVGAVVCAGLAGLGDGGASALAGLAHGGHAEDSDEDGADLDHFD